MANGRDELNFTTNEELSRILPKRDQGKSGVDLTIQDIENFTPPGSFDSSLGDSMLLGALNEAFPQQPSTGALPQSTLFPTLNQPIRQGQFSSPFFSSSIFVPSTGVFPLGVLEERERQKQAAAQARAESLRTFSVGQPPEVNNARFQKKLNQGFNRAVNSSMDEAFELAGGDPIKAKSILFSDATSTGRKFKTRMQNFQLMARNANQVFDQVNSVLDAKKTGKEFVDNETLQLAREAQFAIGRFSDADPKDLVGISNLLSTSLQLNSFLKDSGIISQMKNNPKVREVIFKAREVPGANAKLIESVTKKTFNEQADQMATQLSENEFAGHPFYTKDRIKDRILSSLGSEITRGFKTVSKPDPRGRAGRFSSESRDQVVLRDQNKRFNFGGNIIDGIISVPLKSTDKEMKVAGMFGFTGQGDPLPELSSKVEEFTPTEFTMVNISPETFDELNQKHPELFPKGSITQDEREIGIASVPALIGTAMVERELFSRDSDTGQEFPTGKKEKVQEPVVMSIFGNEERMERDIKFDYEVFKEEFENRRKNRKFLINGRAGTLDELKRSGWTNSMIKEAIKEGTIKVE